MTISYEFTAADGLLRVTARGQDDSLEDVQTYNAELLKIAAETQCFRVLCDERQIEYRLNTLDTFQSAADLAAVIPSNAKIAIVPNLKSFADGKFWETVAFNRGMNVQFFKEMETAEDWITS